MIAAIVDAIRSAPVALWVLFGVIIFLKVTHWLLKLRGRV